MNWILFPLVILCLANPKSKEQSKIVIFISTAKNVEIFNEQISREIGPQFVVNTPENYSKFTNTLRNDRPLAFVAPGNTVSSVTPEGYQPLLTASYKGKHFIPLWFLHDVQFPCEQAKIMNVAVWRFLTYRQMRVWLRNSQSFIATHLVLRVRSLVNPVLNDEVDGVIIQEDQIDAVFHISNRSYVWHEIQGLYMETPKLMIRSDASEAEKKQVASKFLSLSAESLQDLGIDGWARPESKGADLVSSQDKSSEHGIEPDVRWLD